MTRTKRTKVTWVADAVPLPVLITEDECLRPVLIIVTSGRRILYDQVIGRLSGEPEAITDVLADAVRSTMTEHGRPDRLVVRHTASVGVGAQLGMKVTAGQVAAHDRSVRRYVEEITGVDTWPPTCSVTRWDAWDLPVDVVRDVFAAAADFYRSAPWRYIAEYQTPLARLDRTSSWVCRVIGRETGTFGFELFRSRDDLVRVIMAGSRGEPAFEDVRNPTIAINYDTADGVGAEAVRYVREHGLDVAGPAAFPVLITINTPGGGIAADVAAELAVLLRAITAFAEAHRVALELEMRSYEPLDSLRWRHAGTGTRFEYPIINLQQLDPVAAEGVPMVIPGELGEEIARVFRVLGDNVSEETLRRELNNVLDLHMGAYNAAPQGELGGLAPEQVHRLLASDWLQPDGAVRLREDLDAEAVANAYFPRRASAFLAFALRHGPLEATQAGYLRPARLRELIDALDLGPDFVDPSGRSRITETDVWPVHITRIILEVAGLIERRGRRFHVTAEGERLADDARAGELYAHLFRTRFRDFDAGYDAIVDWPELQQQAAFTLYRLPDVAAEWRPLPDLLSSTVLPFALTHAPAGGSPEFHPALFAYDGIITRPLESFGLVECRYGTRPLMDFEYRVTPLYGRFLAVEPD